jgi:chromosome segregation ATPase
MQQENMQVLAEDDRLRQENSGLKEALTEGREVDIATADGARQQAIHAQSAYEQEATAHQETRNMLKTRQEALEAETALAAEAIASAQRRAVEAVAAASSAKESQRAAEGKLSRLTSARDAALARVEDLNAALAQYVGVGDGMPPGHEEVASLQQTVSELENALEAKNVELNRLEGEVGNLRDALNARVEATVLSRDANFSTSRPGGEYSSSHEVEQKLRHMADSALRKQAQLEVLRSENKALQHQLDTERKRTREAQAMAAAATSSRHTLRGGFRGLLEDEERGDRGFGTRGEGPIARFRVPRNWPASFSRFVMSLDKLSAQALGFLRKEPFLRIAILVYLCAMHILVYFMLHHVQTMADSEVVVSAHRAQPLVPIVLGGAPPQAAPVVA